MRPLRFAINVTLDGCYDHMAGEVSESLHRHHTANITRADALLLGRVTYGMMELAFRGPAAPGTRVEWMEPFAQAMDAAKKYVVSKTLTHVNWNSELVTGDLGDAVRKLKAQPGNGLFLGGVQLALALTELGLIDEYEFIVHPVVAGHGPTLFEGLSKRVDLQRVGSTEFDTGAVALRFVPRPKKSP